MVPRPCESRGRPGEVRRLWPFRPPVTYGLDRTRRQLASRRHGDEEGPRSGARFRPACVVVIRRCRRNHASGRRPHHFFAATIWFVSDHKDPYDEAFEEGVGNWNLWILRSRMADDPFSMGATSCPTPNRPSRRMPARPTWASSPQKNCSNAIARCSWPRWRRPTTGSCRLLRGTSGTTSGFTSPPNSHSESCLRPTSGRRSIRALLVPPDSCGRWRLGSAGDWTGDRTCSSSTARACSCDRRWRRGASASHRQAITTTRR